jgi:hypothetical protein
MQRKVLGPDLKLSDDAGHRGWGSCLQVSLEAGRGLAMSLKNESRLLHHVQDQSASVPAHRRSRGGVSPRGSKRLGAACPWCWKDPCSDGCGWGRRVSAGGRLRHPTLSGQARQTFKFVMIVDTSCEFSMWVNTFLSSTIRVLKYMR